MPVLGLCPGFGGHGVAPMTFQQGMLVLLLLVQPLLLGIEWLIEVFRSVLRADT